MRPVWLQPVAPDRPGGLAFCLCSESSSHVPSWTYRQVPVASLAPPTAGTPSTARRPTQKCSETSATKTFKHVLVASLTRLPPRRQAAPL